MTLHARAATDEIYELFNAPIQTAQEQNEESDNDEYMTDDDYTSGGESTCTTRQIEMSDAPDEDEDENEDDDDCDDELHPGFGLGLGSGSGGDLSWFGSDKDVDSGREYHCLRLHHTHPPAHPSSSPTALLITTENKKRKNYYEKE